MALDATTELTIRQALAETAADISEAGYIKPAPQYFSGFREFWAVTDDTIDTQLEVEASLVAGTWIYPVSFADDFTSGGKDSPLVKLRYEFYLFRQYGQMRADESDTPDVFDRKVLAQHNAFIKAFLALKEEFQGDRSIAGIDGDTFVTAYTSSLVQAEPIANQAICEFIPDVVGFAVRLQTDVYLKLKEC